MIIKGLRHATPEPKLNSLRIHGILGRDNMSPEELAFLEKLSEDILEIKAMFKKFTTEKEQRWKDEQARRREQTW